MRWSFCLGIAVILVCAGAAGAQPAPIVVDADTITYDAAAQVVTAEGRVRVTAGPLRVFADAVRYDLMTGVVVATGLVRVADEEGRELRGSRFTYDVRAAAGFLEPIEGVIDPGRRLHVRGERLEFGPGRFVSYQSLFTTCDPGRPLVAVAARRIEITPGVQMVAHDAAVLLGGRRLIGLPRVTLSLAPTEEDALIPSAGFNEVDGAFLEHRFRVRVAGARGSLHLKYGTQSGAFGLLTLNAGYPSLSATLRAGRTQTADERRAFNLLRYDVAEISAQTRPMRLGEAPLTWFLAGGAGWLSDPGAGVDTTRVEGRLQVESDRLVVVPGLWLSAQGSFRISRYATGAVRTIAGLQVDLAYDLDRHTRVRLGYALAEVRGRTPLTVDTVDPESTTSLGVERAVPNRYLFAARVAHNTAVPETRLWGTLAVAVSPSLEVGISGVYNLRTSAFEDVDYTIRSVCDCVDLVLRYRQVRREVSLELGLIGFTERQGPFVPRASPGGTGPAASAGSRAAGYDPGQEEAH